jgi:hypothetical protein
MPFVWKIVKKSGVGWANCRRTVYHARAVFLLGTFLNITALAADFFNILVSHQARPSFAAGVRVISISSRPISASREPVREDFLFGVEQGKLAQLGQRRQRPVNNRT